MDRTANGYNPNNLNENVNPDTQPYFRLHGSDMPWVFGNLYPLRTPNDLYSTQLTSG